MNKDRPLVIGRKKLRSRLFLGTGKFRNKHELAACIKACGTEVVTVALRRIDLKRHRENILEYIPKNVNLLVNTSGARTAREALRIARIAKAAGYGNWIKVEVINDSKYLLPDNAETLKAVRMLADEGFVALPYMFPDLYFAREMAKAGAAAVMPLGSCIGTGMGLQAKEFIKIIVEEIDVPVVVDAGLGVPSHAAEAMEMGVDAVLVNTAVATAGAPVKIARGFALAVNAGRLAYLSAPQKPLEEASPSSPLSGFLFEDKK